MERPAWQLTAAEALPLLRSGDLSAQDYVRSLLVRIEQRDAEVRAWVYLDPSHALTQAKALDELPADKRGPLHGLPVGIKDIALTKDMPTQYNSKIYETKDIIEVDANCVMALRAAGAIIFGKTSTTEFASSSQANWHQNLTVNPHDKTRTPGGSSSGSGAAVGDFQIPVALGTQTGGSITRPASFNGCYGFKPTWGAISREGLAQWCPTLDTCGFLTRSVTDLDILMDAFRIHDDDEAEAAAIPALQLQGAKFGFYNSRYWAHAGPGTQNAMARAKAILQSHGAIVEDVSLPEDFAHVIEWHTAVLAEEGQASFLGQYLTDKEKLHGDIRGHVEERKGVTRKQQLEAYDGCARLRPLFDAVAARYEAIITPSVVDEAPADVGHTGDMNFCSTWTIMQVPALNIPGFAGENGMPIGLTAVCPRFRDRHLLRVARTLGPVFEAEGGWKRKNV